MQLFVQRCLMNLEPRVAASSINAQHWKWMNRYRVWEANRKVFLYPENWIEPEPESERAAEAEDQVEAESGAETEAEAVEDQEPA